MDEKIDERNEETTVAMEDIRVGMSDEQKQRTLAEILRVLQEGQ